MIRFVFNVAGEVVLDRAFNRVNEGLSDLRIVSSQLVPEIYAINAEQFDTEGAAGASGKWAALSPAYRRYKAQQFPGQPILQAHGDLRASLTDPEASDAIFRSNRNELTIGTKLVYGRVHQLGLGRMPRRPIFSFSERQKRRMQKAIQRSLVAFTRRAGFKALEEAA